jgi:hypothetical protein
MSKAYYLAVDNYEKQLLIATDKRGLKEYEAKEEQGDVKVWIKETSLADFGTKLASVLHDYNHVDNQRAVHLNAKVYDRNGICPNIDACKRATLGSLNKFKKLVTGDIFSWE